jgi:hypothetical protein
MQLSWTRISDALHTEACAELQAGHICADVCPTGYIKMGLGE